VDRTLINAEAQFGIPADAIKTIAECSQIT